VVSHPDRPQSNQAHLTVLQYYTMHADITQENNKQCGQTGRDAVLRQQLKGVVAWLFVSHHHSTHGGTI